VKIGDRVRVTHPGTASPDTLGVTGTIVGPHGGNNWIVLLDYGPKSTHIADYMNLPAWYFYEHCLAPMEKEMATVTRTTRRMEIRFYA
jgi:hypothetical protein